MVNVYKVNILFKLKLDITLDVLTIETHSWTGQRIIKYTSRSGNIREIFIFAN